MLWLVVVGLFVVMFAALYVWDRKNRHRAGTALDAAHKEWATDREGQWWNCGGPGGGTL